MWDSHQATWLLANDSYVGFVGKSNLETKSWIPSICGFSSAELPSLASLAPSTPHADATDHDVLVALTCPALCCFIHFSTFHWWPI